MQHLRSVVAVCEMTMQHLRSVVAVCEMTMQHLRSVAAVCETTMQHLRSVVAVCETTMQHLRSVVAVCETTMQHLHSLFIVYEMITQGLHGLFTVCARPFSCPPGRRGAYAIRPYMYPAKLRCPRRGRPYHGDNHSSLWNVWGANAIRPYTSTRPTWQASLMPPPQGPPLPRGQSFIPAGCLGGVCDTPLPGYNHLASGTRQTSPASADAPSQLLGIVNAWRPSLPLRPYF